MQTLVPVDTIPQLLTPIKEVVSEPQFVQIERLVRGLLLVEGEAHPGSHPAGPGGTHQCGQLEPLSGRVALV